ncbi:MAG: PSD1 and planctomycete cytochrome C domain-containing protein [Bryobacteraceae bacterium]|nr:PSD1 and planctomycete cytochrome C domain-containing protein [Bryobacteraceae bacterium]
MRIFSWLAAALCVGQSCAADFNREIRPILSDKCFTCHGPDEATRKGRLRLDAAANGEALDARQRAEVLRRITSDNQALRMPPAYAGAAKLNAREIGLMREWLEAGARYDMHWAFRAPRRPAVPPSDSSWPRNPVDHFILARLKKEGWSPSRETSPESLLRRVSLDLTGLPPSTGEMDAFLADSKAGAYERAVDRLLESPRYGERMAVDWLDAARYADTHGYQVDPQKEMWPWRDWVVNAFNRNQPFDQFTIEQLAGDMLPSATLEQKIASGFHRNHRINTEAGSIAEEFHAENIFDRIGTTGSVWLGLTIGCARCHDHKYDPLSMRDFYAMYAIYNGVPEVGTGGPRDGRGNAAPFLRLPAPEVETQIAKVDQRLEDARAQLKEVESRLEVGYQAWQDSPRAAKARWRTMKPTRLSSREGVKLLALADGSVRASGAHPPKDIYTVDTDVKLENVSAFRLELLPDPLLPGGCSGRGAKGKAELTLFEAKLDGRTLELETATATYGTPESILERVLRPMEQIKRGWTLGDRCGEPHALFIETRNLVNSAGTKPLSIRLGSEWGEGALLGRFRLSYTSDEFPTPLPEEITAIGNKPAPSRTPAEEKQLRRYYVSRFHEHRRAQTRVTAIENLRRALLNRIPSTMVMAQMESPRETHLLMRGQYDKPGEMVKPAVPAILPPLAPGTEANRLSFARWLVSPSHPLTARVTVNRIWQSIFGTGLVKTVEDFGSQGEAPSHPELLDWLAVEFVESGWNVKALIRLMVTSAAYRQSSAMTPEMVERDPENRLLARGPRFRLAAEMIRDQALFAAGLLHEQRGGPPVKPYQPEGYWEQISVRGAKGEYQRSTGASLYRRSLYIYWRRTIPPPGLTTFDAPTREFCVVRRDRSSTPLQALALLNDETYVEAARVLAARMISEGGSTPAERVNYAFRRTTLRPPRPEEMNVLTAGLERRMVEYRKDPRAAEALLKAGESPRPGRIDPVELAAYTTVASVILNLDEVVTKQ